MAETKLTRSPAWRAGIAVVVTATAAALMILVLGADAYPWIKAIHVIAIISWMAGMLYLPRLFVYHSEVPVGSAQSETFKVMEQRLLTLITNPAMVIAWVLGLWLAWKGGYWAAHWFHAKVGPRPRFFQDCTAICRRRRARSLRTAIPSRRVTGASSTKFRPC